MSPPVVAAAAVARRRGILFASIWLVFLAEPLTAAWAARGTVSGVVGGVTTIIFCLAYLALWWWVPRGGTVFAGPPPATRSVPYLVVLFALAAVMIGTLGQAGTPSLVYCAVATMATCSIRVTAVVVAGVVATALVLDRVNPNWSSPVSLIFSVLAAALAVFGIRSLVRRNLELVRAHETNAELAVENERTRFARDLHDILGHSLTVITVKAELANRLLDVDTDRARAELADLERLSRDALADVRRAVEGYRELTLPGELARARAALTAAEIEAELPNSTDEVPTQLRELFAWTVREGVTNVIRHSGATRCTVRLTAEAAEVVDDGPGGDDSVAIDGHHSGGSGLIGLRERAGAVGCTVTARADEPRGHTLRVVLS